MPAFRPPEQLQAVPRLRRRSTKGLEVLEGLALGLFISGPADDPIPCALAQGTCNNQQERRAYYLSNGHDNRVEGEFSVAHRPCLLMVLVYLCQ